MEKTMKRQIGYKPAKNSTKKVSTKTVTPPKHEPIIEQKEPIKMGRKEKAPEDRVQGAKVYLTVKEIALIEGKYGSLTSAMKLTALIEAKK